MNSKKTLPYGALIIGGLIALTGIACVVMYVLEAVLKRIGEGDQSLLFWYLPLLLFGLIGILIGPGIGIWGANHLRKSWARDSTPEN